MNSSNPVIPIDLIPDVVKDIHLSEEQKKVISLTGEVAIKAVSTEKGFRDAFLTFVLDEKDASNPKVHYEILFPEDYKTVIPSFIGKKAVDQDKIRLGLEDGPFKIGSAKKVFFKMDPNTGETEYRVPDGITIPKSVAGYRFTEEEQFLLTNGSKLKEPIVFKNSAGNYISVIPSYPEVSDGGDERRVLNLKGHRVLSEAEVNGYKGQVLKSIQGAETVEKAGKLFHKISHLATKAEQRLYHLALEGIKAKEVKADNKDPLKTQAEVDNLKRAEGKQKDEVVISPETKKEEKIVVEGQKNQVRNEQEEKSERVKKHLKNKTIGLPRRKSNDLGR